VKNILIINLIRLGDIIQTSSVIQGLRKKHTGIRITLVINSNFASATTLLSGIDNVLEVDTLTMHTCLFSKNRSLCRAYEYTEEFFSQLRETHFDMIINITPNTMGVLCALLADKNANRTRSRAGECGWAVLFESITRHWETAPFHLIDIHNKIAGLKPERIVPKVVVEEKYHCRASELLHAGGVRKGDVLIGFFPGASRQYKQWPVKYFMATGKMLQKETDAWIVLFGSDTEKKTALFLEKNLDGRILNTAGKTNLKELAALMGSMDILISNDTGPMHIAAATGTKIISIHTGREMSLSTGPYGQGHVCVQPQLSCYPCNRPEQCADMKCKNAIRPEIIFSAALSLLGKERTTLKTLDATVPVDVSISGFDKNNFLDYYPAQKRPLTVNVFSQKLLRALWIEVLQNDTIKPRHPARTDKSADDLVGIFERHYFIENVTGIRNNWSVVCDGLSKIITYADNGSALSRDIASLCENMVAHGNRIKNAADQLEMLDEKIVAAGHCLKEYVSIIYMFQSEKEHVHSGDIITVARQTADVYEHLKLYCSALQQIGSRCIKRLKEIEKKETA